MINPKISRDILKTIRQSNNILLCLHPGPDSDCLGANLALQLWLKKLGKKVTVIKGDSELKDQSSVFPGYETIVKKDITQINISNYDLFVSADASSYTQISKLIDTSQVLKNIKVIVLDHHIQNKIKTPLKIASPRHAAACELIYDLFRLWHVTITQDIAICLYFGIFGDTAGFVNSNVTPELFVKVSYLTKKIKNLDKHMAIYSYHRQPEEFVYTKVALENIQTFFKGQVAITGISLKELEKNGLTPAQASKQSISELLRSCVDWQITVCLVETEKNKCEVSMRSHSSDYNVAKVALNLGGGGHVVAAGVTLYTDVQGAIKMLLEQIAIHCPQLGKIK